MTALRRAIDYATSAPGALPAYTFVLLVLATSWTAVGIGAAIVAVIVAQLA